jgi:CheY-like chemotaxis protein
MSVTPASTLPLERPGRGLGGSPRPEVRRSCVLIVEDDADIRESLGDALEFEGYDVATAGNGFEALRLLRSGLKPGVILLDLVMPIMSGWQFRQVQLADPSLAGIPVVVVSASAPGDARPDRHLLKPFGIEELLATVATLARHSA